MLFAPTVTVSLFWHKYYSLDTEFYDHQDIDYISITSIDLSANRHHVGTSFRIC